MSLAARENPFRTSRVLRLRYRLDSDGWGRLLDRFERLDHRAALVGPEGSGKTTLLEDLEERLERRGWRIVPLRLSREHCRPTADEWAARLASAGEHDLITVDGVEQLSWWRWQRLEKLSRRASGLLVTSHRAGRLPTLRQHRTNPRLLRELVTDLVGREHAEALRPELERLFVAQRGNVRDCLRQLYDRWASPHRFGCFAGLSVSEPVADVHLREAVDARLIFGPDRPEVLGSTS